MIDLEQRKKSLEDKLRELTARAEELDDDLREPPDDDVLEEVGDVTLEEIRQIKRALRHI